MKKLALYRSFRSQTFSQLIGQTHITKILQNQVSTGNISHAYLFCGTRGTGKTSTAQILARAVNCLTPKNGDPCGECQICLLADNPDIWEIDAASNNGVDQIRELRDNVRFSPMESKYKVYIIDEVHMLSTGAFNALLKTLEEPPSHVVFILATTEPQKLPATILSRCQRFDFRRISTPEISQHLKHVLFEIDNDFSYEDKAVDKIAQMADGSMRDALSLLDQCLFSESNSLTLESVIETVGAIDDSDRFELVSNILNFDAKNALILTDKLISKGLESSALARDLANHFRSISIAISCGEDANSILELGEEEFSRISKQSSLCDISRALKLAETFSYLQLDLRRSMSGRLLLESSIIRSCNKNEYTDISSIASRIAILETKIQQGATISANPITSTPTIKEPINATKVEISSNEDVVVKSDVATIIPSEPEVSHNDNNNLAQNIFLVLQNTQKEGIKRIFSMYEWNETFQNNTLYLTPPKNCIPALLDSLRSKQEEFSSSINDNYPDVSVVFAVPAGAKSVPVSGQIDDKKNLTDKVIDLFGDENIIK